MRLALILKKQAWGILYFFLYIEGLLFLLPTNGKVEGFAISYWGGVRLRLSSGRFWAIALLSGIGAVLLMAVLIAFASYLARFTDISSKK